MKNSILFAFALLGAAGCQSLSNESALTSAQFKLVGKPLDRLDLITRIDPERRRFQLKRNEDCLQKKEPKDVSGTDLQCALAAFETYWMTYSEFEQTAKRMPMKPPEADGWPDGSLNVFYQKKANSYALAIKRNDIQDDIMRHSDDYCGRFESHVSDTRSLFNVTTGGLTTTLAALASIFTEVSTVRALAGAAGITSGLDAQYESAFFQQQALSTVFAGIGLRRERIAEAITQRRFRPLDGTEMKPQTTVVASVMSDGKILDSYKSYTGAELASFKAEPNVLYVIDFAPNETVETPAPGQSAGEQQPAAPKPMPGAVALVSVASYSLERAIGDALIYHHACSITEGLAEAEESIDSYRKDVTRPTLTMDDIISRKEKMRALVDKTATGAPVTE